MSLTVVKSNLAETFLQQASLDVKEKVQRLLNGLSESPFVDMKTKFYFSAPPVMLSICRCEGFWIVYYVENTSNSLKIINIGYAKETPSIR